MLDTLNGDSQLNTMDAILNPDQSDEMIIAMAKIDYEEKTNADLIEYYNRQQKLGMVGVRRQVLHMVALHEVFQERFGHSPFRASGALAVGFGPPIEAGDPRFVH
jgi:hypothetical protein